VAHNKFLPGGSIFDEVFLRKTFPNTKGQTSPNIKTGGNRTTFYI
jgi:hypothetical protein